MFTGVSCFKKSGHHDLYKFRLLCSNLQMSMLCRAKWKCLPAVAAAAKAGQGNQTERVRGSHSLPDRFRGSTGDLFCPGPGGEGQCDGAPKAGIGVDFGAKQVRKSENSHFSRISDFWPFSRWNPLRCNPFQPKQTGGFLGFPEKFSGGGIRGGGVNES